MSKRAAVEAMVKTGTTHSIRFVANAMLTGWMHDGNRASYYERCRKSASESNGVEKAEWGMLASYAVCS